MSLLWCDIPDRSQGLYGDDESLMLDGLWAEAGRVILTDDPDPSIGSTGRVLQLDPGVAAFPGIARWVLPGTRNEVGMGCRVWVAEIPQSEGRAPEIHTYRDNANDRLISVSITPTGSIRVDSGERYNSLLAESAQDVISANAWRHVESEVTFSATTGTVKVWVEGVLVIDESNLNTGSVDCAQVAFVNKSSPTSNQTVTYIKDVFIRDGLGTTNNGQIGTCSVFLLRPNADVSSGWARSSGSTDYELVDNTPPVDTDYISADDTPPAASIMELTDLPSDVVSVRGLVSVSRSIKTDAGDGNLQVSLSPNGTDWDTGADNAVTTTYTYDHDVSELSPDTGAAWTPTEVNSARIRLDRTA